ncbi:hypothetical protein H8D30_06785 [bacterium]|nr:hypothetical protein [bacterium]
MGGFPLSFLFVDSNPRSVVPQSKETGKMAFREGRAKWGFEKIEVDGVDPKIWE